MNLPPILILAGGMGTRVAHIAGNLPKCLIPINQKPFLDWQLDLLERNHLRKVVYSVGYREEAIRNYLLANPRKNLEVKFVSDGEKPLGTGGAVLNSLTELGDEFFVIYGDSYLPTNFSKFYEFARNYDACLSIFKNEDRYEKSNVWKKKSDLVAYKKFPMNKNYDYVDYGLLYFRSSVFTTSTNNFFDLAEILENLSLENKLYGYEVTERFYEIGSESGIADLASWICEKYA